MRLAFVLSWISIALAQEASLPPDHPVLPSTDRRTAASRLTNALSGAPVAAGAVPRKNFIDGHIFGQMERDGVPHAPLATDAEFFRRLHLDFTGRIGEDAALRAFVADTDPLKRDKLIDRLANSPAFRAKWTYWFGDLSKTAANRVGGEGKNLYYRWIYDNLQVNRPYNEIVRDLLTPNAVSNWYVGPASYLARWVVVGVKCEETVHEDTSDELAINSVKHFLGINLECISCHDGAHHLEKINKDLAARKRSDVWQMAAFFGKTRILRRVELQTTQDEYSIDEEGPGYDASARTVVRMPRRGKGIVEPAFLLTGEKPDPAKNLRAEYARMLTSHPQFARATVNMFWADLMGVGIVDPVHDFDLARSDQATHPELLDALAADFRTNNHSLRHLLTTIAKSSAYQLSSRFPGEWKDAYAKYYARKFVRRLKAEEIHDSITAATRQYSLVPIRGTQTVAKFATETRTPEDYKSVPSLKDVNFFLESFGQTNREFSERTNEGDITQAVLLMNSPFILKQAKAAPGSYLAELLEAKQPLEANIRSLFARFLQREPTPAELATSKDLIQSNPQKGYEDLQWLLLNKVEFLFNY